MKLELSNKRAVVTGSTAGIGFATALALAREGARVVLNGRTSKRTDDAVARLRKEVSSADVDAVPADVSTAEGCATLIREVPECDILVNNMGIFEVKPFDEISDADWMRFFEANVMSGVRLSRHYLRGMKRRNWGRIVFVSSESGVQLPAEMIHYGVTKTAQIALARGMAETLAGTGVTVNSVLPGPTMSEGVTKFVTQLAKEQHVDASQVERDFFKTARPTSLLRRFIQPEEVANLIVYVCSAAASATQGSALRVDGGVIRAAV
jgi:NAD(P)-dependent dehydrogenase (short-subunit alcohol dehydrogenase family)